MSCKQGKLVQATFLDMRKAYNHVPTIQVCSGNCLTRLFQTWIEVDGIIISKSTTNCKDWCRNLTMENCCIASQGTVSGPGLCLIFIDDLPNAVRSKPAIFPEDCTIFSDGQDALSTDRNTGQDWAGSWIWKIWMAYHNECPSQHL